MFFTDVLLPKKLKAATRLLASFFLGFVVLAFVYYLQSFMGMDYFITAFGPLVSLIAIVKWVRNGRPNFFNEGERFDIISLILFLFLILASFLSFEFKYLGALSGETTQVYHDFLFHTGNIASLSRSFPNMDIRVEGLVFYYHYFYELIFAMCKNIFGMDAFRLYMNGNMIVCAWPLTLACIIIAERLRAGKEVSRARYFFYCTGIFVSCICLLPINIVGGTFPISWMDNHFFGNGNAMGLAASLSVLLIDIISDIWQDGFRKKTSIAIALLTIAATGFKGTTGMLIIAMMWSVFIVELVITRKFSKAKLLYSIDMTLAFVITYVFVTVGLNASGSNNRAMTFSPLGTLENSRVGQVFEKYLGLDYTFLPLTIIGAVLCGICIVGPMLLPFAGFAAKKFKGLIRFKEIGDIFDWFVIGSVIMGVIGYCVISVPGASQVYLVITNAFFIFYGAVKFIMSRRSKLVNIISYITIGFGIIFLCADMVYFVYSGIAQEQVYHSEAGDDDSLVDADTLDAYLWLRDNTEEDALVAVDRITESLDYRDIYFYCSAFSERQCYLEGYDYSDITEESVNAMKSINNKFYSSDKLEACTAMDLVGIDYVVVTEHSHPGYSTSCPYQELVYENDSVQIYRHTANTEERDKLSITR